MHKKIKFLLKNITRIIIDFLISLLPRDKHLIIMGLRTPKHIQNGGKDYFMHNTKALFLKYSKTNNYGINFIYLSDDNTMINKFKELGYKNVYKRNSLMGIFYSLRAKYWIYDDRKYCIGNQLLSGGAVCINLWHGTGGLKSVGNVQNKYKNPLLSALYIKLLPKDTYYNVDSEHEVLFRKYIFGANEEQIKILGSPRIDVLYNDFDNQDIFLEDDFKNIKNFKNAGKKLIFYTPTFRDTGKDISGWLKSEELNCLLKEHQAILVCKLHFADKNSLDFKLPKTIYKMQNNSDIYPVLKFADALISDYSSIYFDFLLLDKPIIYYVPDLEEYQKQCRGFYEPYEQLTAGKIVYNKDSLYKSMIDVFNGVDNYKEKREKLRNQTFKYQDGRNCERVMEFIVELSNN